MEKGIIQKQYDKPVKRFVQTMELRDDPELIALYRKAHSEEECWKEIVEGIRAVGILEMELYILGTRLVMIVDTPTDFNWDEAMSRLATLPRQAEWEQYVARFQKCAEEQRSDEKWQMMERMFHLY
jgi:L-rhamnose mutarotase